MYSFITFATENPTSRHLSHGLASNKHCTLLLADTSLNPSIPNTVPQEKNYKKIQISFRKILKNSTMQEFCQNGLIRYDKQHGIYPGPRFKR